MACPAVRSSILRNSSIRHYAASAAAQVQLPPADLQVIDKKITVAALESKSPIAQISIVFKAGPRNETYETQGTSHILRIAAGLKTNCASAFKITRYIQQLGGILTATTDRETTAYTIQVTKDKVDEAAFYLRQVATCPLFRPWEISDQIPRLRYELSTIPEAARLIDLLHKAAYRTGLGYSLYCPKRQIDKIDTETLKHFVSTWCTAPRCAVVGTGICLSGLSSFASLLELGAEDNPTPPSKYAGGELRKERDSLVASVALAVEGTGFNKEKDALALAILNYAAGTGPCVKWGSSPAPLYKSVASAVDSNPFAVTSFNVSYTDSGLYGFVLQTPPEIAGKATRAAYKWLRAGNVSDADVARGKALLKSLALSSTECATTQLENLSHQALFKGKLISPFTLAADIEKVSAADVKSIAKKVGSGKVSMAAIGDIGTVPYIDEL